MDVVLAAVRVVVAVMLATSALEKLRAPDTFFGVLRDLGLVRIRWWWLAVCLTELLVAVLLLTSTPSAYLAAAVAVLGLAFAAAGTRALLLGKEIRCACFGHAGRGPLGWAQLLVLPLWLAAAYAVYSWTPATTEQQAALLASVMVLLPAIRAFPVARAVMAAREDRRAMAGGLPGRQDHASSESNPRQHDAPVRAALAGGG
jgi:hypothetical protein